MNKKVTGALVFMIPLHVSAFFLVALYWVF
jgi:hypothetical protein